MAELDPASATPPAEPSAGPGPAVSDPRIDPERVAALEAYYARTNPILEQYQEDFNAIVEDEGYRDFQRTSRKSYYQMLEEQKKAEQEQLAPGERRLLDEIRKEFKPALEEVGVLRTEREARTAREATAAKEASEKFARENVEFANRLVAEQKVTSEEVLDLSRFAKILHDESVAKGEPRFVGLEEVYKRVYGRAEAKAAPAVPKSLRSRSGAPGVPGASRPDPGEPIDSSKPGSFTNEMLRRLNNQRKTG
jgi:hypothetical protein